MLTGPIVVIPLTAWVQNNLIKVQLATSEYGRIHDIPVEVVIPQTAELQHEINTYTTVALVSAAAFIFCLLSPLLYRLLLYILHGNSAFRPRGPKPQSMPPPRTERQSRTGQRAEERPDPFTVLGVSRNATFEEIKRAYRTKMREYHPDKVASLGAELREVAERKAKQINEAFETLSQQYATA
jgi:hypothetical protein